METYFKKIVYPHLEHKICFMENDNDTFEDILIFCESCGKVIYDEKSHFKDAVNYYDKIIYGEI